MSVLTDFRTAHHVPGATICMFDADPRGWVSVGRLSAELPHGTVDPSKVFPTYSVAKLLTTTLVCALDDAATLDLDATVVEYVPELALRPGIDRGALTLRHLLSNSSGLTPDWVAEGLGRNPGDLGPEVLRDVRRMPHITEPGKLFGYSNTGMSLGGHVAKRLTGTSFDAAVGDILLRPLGMQPTTYDLALALTHPLLQQYVVDANGRLAVSHVPQVATRHQPAGLCFSTRYRPRPAGRAASAPGPPPGHPQPAGRDRRRGAVPPSDVDVPVEVALDYGLGALVTRRGGTAASATKAAGPACGASSSPPPTRGEDWSGGTGTPSCGRRATAPSTSFSRVLACRNPTCVPRRSRCGARGHRKRSRTTSSSAADRARRGRAGPPRMSGRRTRTPPPRPRGSRTWTAESWQSASATPPATA